MKMRKRCRKGDMQIDLEGAELRTVHFVDRDRVKPEVRARIAERINYLHYLAASISDADWSPKTFSEWQAAPSKEESRG